MLNPDQKKIVTEAFTHLINNEKRGWDSLDDYLNLLEFLDDDQLYREASVVYSKHENVKVGCEESHPPSECFIPLLVEAVSYILELYMDTNNLHINNRYILSYYLAMNQVGLIVTY